MAKKSATKGGKSNGVGKGPGKFGGHGGRDVPGSFMVNPPKGGAKGGPVTGSPSGGDGGGR